MKFGLTARDLVRFFFGSLNDFFIERQKDDSSNFFWLSSFHLLVPNTIYDTIRRHRSTPFAMSD